MIRSLNIATICLLQGYRSNYYGYWTIKEVKNNDKQSETTHGRKMCQHFTQISISSYILTMYLLSKTLLGMYSAYKIEGFCILMSEICIEVFRHKIRCKNLKKIQTVMFQIALGHLFCY